MTKMNCKQNELEKHSVNADQWIGWKGFGQVKKLSKKKCILSKINQIQLHTLHY